jgi:hypothetical protein
MTHPGLRPTRTTWGRDPKEPVNLPCDVGYEGFLDSSDAGLLRYPGVSRKFVAVGCGTPEFPRRRSSRPTGCGGLLPDFHALQQEN